jgi:hypothetical protein
LANIGLSHTLYDTKTAVTITLSDMFGSLRERTHIDTPILKQDLKRRLSRRILYVGLVYTFGKNAKKSKKDELQFNNAP